MSITVIANPTSAGGRTKKLVPGIKAKLEEGLGPVDIQWTDKVGAATDLTRAALRQGSKLIIAVGGDGTVNECVNGFFDGTTPIAPDAELGIIMSGTGGDFRRTLHLGPDVDDYIETIIHGHTKTIDIGAVSHISNDGQKTLRLFDNISSFGLSGLVGRGVNGAKISKLFGGTFSFYWHTLTTMMRYKRPLVRVQVDDHFDEVVSVNNAAICNGQYFGGGMWIAPMADLMDGTFEVVILKDATFIDMLKDTGSIYEGEHLENPRLFITRGKKIIATPLGDKPVLIDADGETPGQLPATFEIIPKALTIRC